MIAQVLVEGLILGILLMGICMIGIQNGAVGMVHLYHQDVQDRCVELGLTTHEKIRKNSKTFKIVCIPGYVSYILVCVYGGKKNMILLHWQMCRGTWKEPSGNFFGNRKWDFQIINQKTFPEILYNEYGKWKYLPAGKVSETAKDDTHKNKTSSFDTGVLRKSLPGNRENFPDAKRAAGTIRNRGKGLHYVMKG